jgi:GH15 family glucan-1,4-alpha-glucosidase
MSGTFPPIAEYAFLSDREVMALVAPDGNVEWLCLPRPDAPSVFGSALDRSAGGLRLAPADHNVPAGRRYLPGTLVLETTWQTKTGWLVVQDALLIGPWFEAGRDDLYLRPPEDVQAEHTLVRTVECITGYADVALSCEPVFAYGRTPASWSFEGKGYGNAVATGSEDDPTLRLTTDLRLGFEGANAVAMTKLREGDKAFVAISWTEREGPTTYAEAEERITRTADYWRGWLVEGTFPDHPWRTYLEQSALTLKGLTYAPTGALLAAATTSFPESPGGERNWDYRYSWVRDSTFALWGLYTLGFADEADAFFSFIADQVRRDGDIQIMYGVGGERILTERELYHLSGYENSLPVRIGNGAYDQRQHDVWGALLDSVWLHARSRHRLVEWAWPLVELLVGQAIERWREPDHGIWEVRGEPQHFTSSKIMCWVALDRSARLAELRGEQEFAEKWQGVADEIHADVLAHGVDGRGAFTQSYGSDALDASCLLAVLLRFLPPDDERIRATVLAIADELTVDGLVLRYKVEETDDGLSGEEGSFTICSFWLASALADIGEVERARSLLERLLSFASPLGLYAEELDPLSGRHLGNFPQAFTHLALINAVVHVIRAEESSP